MSDRICILCAAEIPEGKAVNYSQFRFMACHPTCSKLVTAELKDHSNSPKGRFRNKREVLQAVDRLKKT